MLRLLLERVRPGARRGIPVTVCVAAMCMNGSVLWGTADRMLTSAAIEFEPQQSKIIPLTNSIAVMTAGDSALQAEVMRQVGAEVGRRIQAEPSNWLTVREISLLYNHYYNIERNR